MDKPLSLHNRNEKDGGVTLFCSYAIQVSARCVSCLFLRMLLVLTISLFSSWYIQNTKYLYAIPLIQVLRFSVERWAHIPLFPIFTSLSPCTGSDTPVWVGHGRKGARMETWVRQKKTPKGTCPQEYSPSYYTMLSPSLSANPPAWRAFFALSKRAFPPRCKSLSRLHQINHP